MTSFTRFLPAAFALTAALAATPAMAHMVLAADNFNSYIAGPLNGQNGGTGWDGGWTGTTNATVAAAAAGDAPMAGQTLLLSGNVTGAATRKLASTISSNVLISFDFQFDAGEITNNDFLGFWFGSSSGPNIGLKADCGSSSGCTNDLFARTSGTGAGGNFQNIEVGITYTILGYLQKIGTSTVYNRFDLWVNPTAHEWATLTGADAFHTGNANIGSFNQIGFRTATLASGDVLRIDNLNISKVPEPGTLALLGLALAGIAAASKRRKA